MSSAILVAYIRSKEGAVTLSRYDHRGMLLESSEMKGVNHVSIEAEKCSLDISFAEFDYAIMLRVSGGISYKQVNNVLEVRCVGS